jgi:hypothetical protein
MSSQEEHDDNVRDVRAGFLWCLLIGVCVLALVGIITAGIFLISWATAGPQDKTRANFANACAKQFAAQVYEPACVEFATGK